MKVRLFWRFGPLGVISGRGRRRLGCGGWAAVMVLAAELAWAPDWVIVWTLRLAFAALVVVPVAAWLLRKACR